MGQTLAVRAMYSKSSIELRLPQAGSHFSLLNCAGHLIVSVAKSAVETFILTFMDPNTKLVREEKQRRDRMNQFIYGYPADHHITTCYDIYCLNGIRIFIFYLKRQIDLFIQYQKTL